MRQDEDGLSIHTHVLVFEFVLSNVLAVIIQQRHITKERLCSKLAVRKQKFTPVNQLVTGSQQELNNSPFNVAHPVGIPVAEFIDDLY